MSSHRHHRFIGCLRILGFTNSIFLLRGTIFLPKFPEHQDKDIHYYYIVRCSNIIVKMLIQVKGLWNWFLRYQYHVNDKIYYTHQQKVNGDYKES